MAIYKTEAFVIKTFDFRESSLIVQFYSRQFGKLSGLLKGIRKEPRKFASTLEPFSLNEVIFYKKRNSELHLVSQCDLRNNFAGIRNDVQKIAYASSMMDLLDIITSQQDPSAEIFNLTLECLQKINETIYAQKIVRIFKIKILSFSGFKPHFDSCICCGDKILDKAKFSFRLGGLICYRCFSRDIKSRLVFRGTVATIRHIEKNNLADNLRLGINQQIKRELDLVLNTFLEFHLGKRLKSEKVLSEVAVGQGVD
jgi:DNA repair protein RecO (recombination protein O)